MILIIKHVDIEGPGTIEEYFQNNGFQLKTIELHRGDRLPDDFMDVEAIASLGGPMNVYEEDKFPFLKAEDKFLKKVIQEEVPFLGICLGSQLLAKACGAQVTKSPVKEVGWFKVQLNQRAQQDPLFKGLSEHIDVFHWHEDMFAVPAHGVLLATAVGCPHQAFKVGMCAYGVQFHVEVTETIIADWCNAYLTSGDPHKQEKAQAMIKIYEQKKKDFSKQSNVIYRNFEQYLKKNAKVKG